MQVSRWMTCLMALILEGVSNSVGAPNAQAVSLTGGYCEGYDHKENIYNLAGLHGKPGDPR